MRSKNQAITLLQPKPDDLATVLDQTGALAGSEQLFTQFDHADLTMPRLAWNMGKSGMRNPATGRRIENDAFFDLRNETVLGSELTGTILYVGKGHDYRKFDGEKTVIHCRSTDRVVGYPRTDKVTATRSDGGCDCATCPSRKPVRKELEDGRSLLVPECTETYEVLFLDHTTTEVNLITLRGKSYRQFKPLIQKFFGVRVQGKLVNVPWYVRKVSARLVLAEKGDYAVCEWHVGSVSDAETILWARHWVDENLARFTRPAIVEPAVGTRIHQAPVHP